MMQHIIKKQIIDLSLDKKLDAFFIQQKVSDEYYSKILPRLPEAFDAFSNDGEVIEIDSLAVDIGTIDLKDLDKGNWTKMVIKKITEQLNDINLGLSCNVKTLRKTAPLSSSDQWIFYMRHGYLPWNVLALTENWYSNVLGAFSADSNAISKLRDLIKNDPGSTTRMVSQNSESFLSSLVETLTAENQAELITLINEIATVVSLPIENVPDVSSSDENWLRQRLWSLALKFAASSEKQVTTSKITFQLLMKTLSMQQLRSMKGRDFLLKNKIETAVLEKIIKEKDDKSDKGKDVISIGEKTGKEYKNGINEEGIFITNAGIILLHPFLNQFFKNLQLIKEDDFVDALSHQKALFLLHYLATGNAKPDEHDLVIAKILCGYPLEEPVNNLIELAVGELDESVGLLLSIISQWSILKGTSVDGLREGFFQRNGKLFTKNGTLILQVEQGSIDMLLDHLPWNLSLIKLPWMTDILKVEWR